MAARSARSATAGAVAARCDEKAATAAGRERTPEPTTALTRLTSVDATDAPSAARPGAADDASARARASAGGRAARATPPRRRAGEASAPRTRGAEGMACASASDAPAAATSIAAASVRAACARMVVLVGWGMRGERGRGEFDGHAGA
jgi:cobalamin biosynthesis Mg chelatase CobN